MKTLTYKIAKGMRSIIGSLIILAALCSVSKGAVSGKEFLQNNNELAIQVKSWLGSSTYWSAPENLQAEELSAAVADSNANVMNQADSQELSHEMESLIRTGSYWNDETATGEEELARQIKSWMSSNSYWSNDTESTETDLAIRMKSCISNGTYWSEEIVNEEPDLALQIKSWINNGSFWKDSNDQSEIRTELASN